MKKILIYLMIFSVGTIFYSCDKPAPTELIDDVDGELEVELLNKDLDDYNIITGADTSGITQDLTGITNLISVSGIKITANNKTGFISLAQTMFFNKSEPIKYSDGRILAYRTDTLGIVKFNGIEANVVPYRIKYRDMLVLKDTLIGYKYQLYNFAGPLGIPDPFYFSYNASVSFEFDPSGPGKSFAFNIPTPPEIVGQVALFGHRHQKNLEAVLTWNPGTKKRISIIIGVIRPGQKSSIPIYKIKTADDGLLRIPGRYFNELPLERFEKVVFTFVRSYEGYHRNEIDELLASSQSIHSIVIDIP